MDHAIRVRVTVREDHTIRLPDEIPTGEAEVIVLMSADRQIDPLRTTEARQRIFGVLRGEVTIGDDFDAPLPDDVLNAFEGRNQP